MIKELVNFTQNLDEEFKILGSLPKEGLHIRIRKKVEDQVARIDLHDFEYEIYSKKMKELPSEFLLECKVLHQNAWCIDTNKCFDLPKKAIHTCSPFCVAFKKEHLKGGAKYIENESRKKAQINDRFKMYFEKAFSLLVQEVDKEKYIVFRDFFIDDNFTKVINAIEEKNISKRAEILLLVDNNKIDLKNAITAAEKETIKSRIIKLEQQLLTIKKLDDTDYLLFYYDVSLEEYKKAHKRYLDDKLFNTDKYNTTVNEEGLIFGTNNFMNGFNSNMPFLMHQTAPFDISSKISNVDAKLLNDLKNLLPNKTLPNPLPIFIYKEELQEDVISIFKESGFKIGYKEIIQELIDTKSRDVSNYYLLFWLNTMEGIVFKDFDYVSKFEYLLEPPIGIQNLFDLKEKGGMQNKHYSILKNVFEFENQVFKPFIQSKYLRLDYFGDLNKDDYSKLDLTFISFSKYRKTVYDFVYKSQRNTIDGHVFYEMVFNSILDDIKNSNEYGVKEKLNIWYSLFNFFNPKTKINMSSKLKEYQDFVTALIAVEDVSDVTDEKFAFAAGQAIEYILSKSRAADKSHVLLEPYLQQSKCTEFKKVIANDFARYSHEKFSKNFEHIAAFVLSYETDTNMKHLLPEILSGIFAKNQLFSSKL